VSQSLVGVVCEIKGTRVSTRTRQIPCMGDPMKHLGTGQRRFFCSEINFVVELSAHYTSPASHTYVKALINHYRICRFCIIMTQVLHLEMIGDGPSLWLMSQLLTM